MKYFLFISFILMLFKYDFNLPQYIYVLIIIDIIKIYFNNIYYYYSNDLKLFKLKLKNLENNLNFCFYKFKSIMLLVYFEKLFFKFFKRFDKRQLCFLKSKWKKTWNSVLKYYPHDFLYLPLNYYNDFDYLNHYFNKFIYNIDIINRKILFNLIDFNKTILLKSIKLNKILYLQYNKIVKILYYFLRNRNKNLLINFYFYFLILKNLFFKIIFKNNYFLKLLFNYLSINFKYNYYIIFFSQKNIIYLLKNKFFKRNIYIFKDINISLYTIYYENNLIKIIYIILIKLFS